MLRTIALRCRARCRSNVVSNIPSNIPSNVRLNANKQVDGARRQLAAGTGSDLVAILHAYNGWRAAERGAGGAAARSFANKHFLSVNVLVMLREMKEERWV